MLCDKPPLVAAVLLLLAVVTESQTPGYTRLLNFLSGQRRQPLDHDVQQSYMQRLRGHVAQEAADMASGARAHRMESDDFGDLYDTPVNFTAADMEDVTPHMLEGREAAQLNYPRSEMTRGHTTFHWAITACGRRAGWSRGLSTTLISAWASDVHPLTISIIWCDVYDPDKVPSIFKNVRFSRKVRVLYLPKHMQNRGREKTTVNFLRALSIPMYYGTPNVPVLVTEDDIVFAPEFNLKLSQLVQDISLQVGPHRGRPPYMLALYRGYLPQDMNVTLSQYFGEQAKWHVSRPGGAADMFVKDEYYWGCQAVYFSPGMAQALSYHFAQVMELTHNVVGYQDMIIFDFIYKRFNCSTMQQWKEYAARGSGRQGRSLKGVTLPSFQRVTAFQRKQQRPRCLALQSHPSLVEHVGAASSLFSEGAAKNSRFHVSWDFPFIVGLPWFDPKGTWGQSDRRRHRVA